MTTLEILERLDESIKAETKMKEACAGLRDYYLKKGELEMAMKEDYEVKLYTHSIANSIVLRCEIERSLDDEAERMMEELKNV